MKSYYSFGQFTAPPSGGVYTAPPSGEVYTAPPSNSSSVSVSPVLAPRPGMAALDTSVLQQLATGQLQLTRRAATPAAGTGKVLPLAVGALAVLMLLG